MFAAEVSQASGLKLRTVRYALAKLREMGAVDVLVDPLNPRRRVYCAKWRVVSKKRAKFCLIWAQCKKAFKLGTCKLHGRGICVHKY